MFIIYYIIKSWTILVPFTAVCYMKLLHGVFICVSLNFEILKQN